MCKLQGCLLSPPPTLTGGQSCCCGGHDHLQYNFEGEEVKPTGCQVAITKPGPLALLENLGETDHCLAL